MFEPKLAAAFVTSLTLSFIAVPPYAHKDLFSDVLRGLYKPSVVVLSFALLGMLGALRPNC